MEIPVVHFFNNKYVVPAAVSFYSMLENASKAHNYVLYVGHSDISKANQEKLRALVEKFDNAKIVFLDMNKKFDDLFNKTKRGGNFSREIYYKFLVASLFPEYEKAIVTDVDVVFTGDIANDFVEFDVSDERYYLAGVKDGLGKKGSFLDEFEKIYDNDFTTEEKSLLTHAGGYYIFNLLKIRKDGLEDKFIEFAKGNCDRIIQPEQDTINIVCGTMKKNLHPRALVCSYHYDMYKKEEDYGQAKGYNAKTVKDALENPIQVHYATTRKPWLVVCPKQELWFSYLVKTDFFEEYMSSIMSENRKVLFQFSIGGRRFKFTKEHDMKI